MAGMITKLTKRQEKYIDIWREKCLAIGKNTSDIDKKTTEKVLSKFYQLLKLKPPAFWYCHTINPIQSASLFLLTLFVARR